MANASSSGIPAGSVTSLNTEHFVSTAETFKNFATSFSDVKDEIRTATTNLFEVWQGDARNTFEAKYDLFYSKLEDIEDWFFDSYETILESYNSYQDADTAVAKAISGN